MDSLKLTFVVGFRKCESPYIEDRWENASGDFWLYKSDWKQTSSVSLQSLMKSSEVSFTPLFSSLGMSKKTSLWLRLLFWTLFAKKSFENRGFLGFTTCFTKNSKSLEFLAATTISEMLIEIPSSASPRLQLFLFFMVYFLFEITILLIRALVKHHVTSTQPSVCSDEQYKNPSLLMSAVRFQMVELHAGKLLPDDAHNAQAIMLLFDDESTPTIKRIQEYVS